MQLLLGAAVVCSHGPFTVLSINVLPVDLLLNLSFPSLQSPRINQAPQPDQQAEKVDQDTGGQDQTAAYVSFSNMGSFSTGLAVTAAVGAYKAGHNSDATWWM